MTLDADLLKEFRTALVKDLRITNVQQIAVDLGFNPDNIVKFGFGVSESVNELLQQVNQRGTGTFLDLLESVSDILPNQQMGDLLVRIRNALEKSSVAEPSPQLIRTDTKRLTFVIEDDTHRRINNGPRRTVAIDRLHRDTASVFSLWHTSRVLAREDEIRVFGTHLFKILFGSGPSEDDPPGQRLLLRALAEHCPSIDANDGKYLRLELQFKDKNSELARLPWEFLYVPSPVFKTDDETDWPASGFFLTRQKRITLTRTPTNVQDVPPGHPPLCVLVIDARTTRTPVSGSDDMKDPDLSWLASKDLEPIKFKHLPAPRFTDVEKELKGNFQVVHFIGQGYEDGDYLLSLADGESMTQTQVGDKLRQARLVVLQVAASAPKKSYEVFVRIAMSQENLSAVVVVQLEGDGATFVEELYRSLLRSEPIEWAVQNARSELGIHRGAFGSPIVLLKNRGAIVSGSDAQSTGGGRQSGRTDSQDEFDRAKKGNLS